MRYTTNELITCLEARLKWYENAINFKSKEIRTPFDFVFPDGSIDTWAAVVRELRNTINMMRRSNTKMTVVYSKYEDDILVSEEYPDGSVNGEFRIVDTKYGFQLQAFYDSWKIFGACGDLFDLLSNVSYAGITMEMLAYMIKNIGYELKVV